MTGKYHIEIQNRHLKYAFDIRRNLTIIQGSSATGKTTLVDMIREYNAGGASSGIQLSCGCPCRVLEGDLWRELLALFHNTILFIDEDNAFVETQEFAEAVRGSSNYFVIITRENLDMLPVSVDEVYGIRSSGKYGGLTPVYHEMYHIYGSNPSADFDLPIRPERIITEDSNAGFEFFSAAAGRMGAECISASGRTNIFSLIAGRRITEELLIIADGAAFASQMNRIGKIASRNPHIHLFLPESFEWLILKSGVLDSREIRNILDAPEEYIDSEKYFSWEQYFTALLTESSQDGYLRYTKRRLNPTYLHARVMNAILAVMEGITLSPDAAHRD